MLSCVKTYVTGKFMREVCEVTEFFVNDKNEPEANTIYRKNVDGTEVLNGPSNYLIDYLMSQGVDLTDTETLKNVSPSNVKTDISINNQNTNVQNNSSNNIVNNQPATLNTVVQSGTSNIPNNTPNKININIFEEDVL